MQYRFSNLFQIQTLWCLSKNKITKSIEDFWHRNIVPYVHSIKENSFILFKSLQYQIWFPVSTSPSKQFLLRCIMTVMFTQILPIIMGNIWRMRAKSIPKRWILFFSNWIKIMHIFSQLNQTEQINDW